MPACGGWGLGRAADMMAPRKTSLTPYPLATGLRFKPVHTGTPSVSPANGPGSCTGLS